MKPGDAVHVTPPTVHRMTAIEDCDVFEVSTPELHDVVRLEDRYGGRRDAVREPSVHAASCAFQRRRNCDDRGRAFGY